MPIYYRAKNSAAYIFQGWTYEQGPDGVLRALTANEWEARTWSFKQLTGRDLEAGVAQWAGADILALSRIVGIWEFTGSEQDRSPRGLTGRIIGRSADVNNKDGSDFRHFPRAMES